MNSLRRFLRWIAARYLTKTAPPPDHSAENNFLREALSRLTINPAEEARRQDYYEKVGELLEARQMAGTGPWKVDEVVLRQTDALLTQAAERLNSPGPLAIRETAPGAVGATSDIELALQNIEWTRELNLSWMEFSRWGIQQLILISRLHYVKNPWIQRAVNVVAAYVFGRGVELVSDDQTANDVLQDFLERNNKIFGQSGLTNLHRRLLTDGQVFFAFFPNKLKTGTIEVRTIDATEIQEIITNPDDADEHWFYRRKWTRAEYQPSTNSYISKREMGAFYPAMGWEPTKAQRATQEINHEPIMWDIPVCMFKGGTGVAKWHFDTPKCYAALDWAKAGRKWLEACMTVRQALAQFAMLLTTKGGQQAMAGAKDQLSTTVGPTSNLWDQNPPTVKGGVFASGPGTTIEAFNTKGAGGDPKDVGEYRSMVANTFEIPATWLGDYTAILATATTLDRPTELGMLEKQERWRELLIAIATYVLRVSQGATQGQLREAKKHKLKVVEKRRVKLANGYWMYEKSAPAKDSLELKVIFPAIREGDMPQNVKAIVEAMTLDNKGGQIVGIDEKVGVTLLFEQLGVEDAGDIVNEMYPETGKNKYDPNRAVQELTAPIGKLKDRPGGDPSDPGGQTADPDAPAAPGEKPPSTKAKESAARLIRAVQSVKEKKHGGSK